MIGGRKDIWFIKEPVPLIPRGLFRNRWRRRVRGEMADPG